MTKIFAVITIILLLISVGCGFAIHYGGKDFKKAINGHIILGVLTLISGIIMIISMIFGWKIENFYRKRDMNTKKLFFAAIACFIFTFLWVILMILYTSQTGTINTFEQAIESGQIWE